MKKPKKILHNLKIEIVCPKITFEDGKLKTAKDQIRDFGLIIDWAEKNLGGSWQIREDGLLIQGFDREVESIWEGEIDIEINSRKIISLRYILEKGNIAGDLLCDLPDIDFSGGGSHQLKAINKQLYIAGFYEGWQASFSEIILP